ncbi:hypothetical protein GUY44_02760 [Pimelobacter simplex]|uniref:Transcriptional regulator, TetR family n=1 Tax=Nocardioides simplex TaxID=2045 RepID=A0A0C5XI47_NOCSI|nr:TetR/AcrR family transcriptional regulator [Pimelobacter simplex]AJR18806.1 Transcriptional regulator, TetR family [Pimelobacter simplex]MCG8149386.1 hypothetical protein [Pimelobacter simplex]GEB16488.1 hypothetical protein NSI01_48030 [Pimelobacter simplex]SFM19772.1 transcriptional regulator, TetR family [Pimelobacter simplex]
MARPEDPTRRPQLLQQIIDYLEDHRLSDLRIRSAAEFCGVSGPVLVYQFGTRDELVAAVVAEAERRMRGVAEEHVAEGVGAALRAFWRWTLEEPRAATLLGISVEWQVLERRSVDPAGEASEGARFWVGWIDLFAERLRSAGVPSEAALTEATFLHGGLLGLCLDYWITGDRERIGLAFEELAVRADVVAASGAS